MPISLRSLVWASCDDREEVVGDAVRRALGVQHLQVQHAVDADLHVVARDADLLGDVDRLLLERVPVADHVDERHQDVEAGVERAGELAQALDDVGALLRHDDRRLRDDDDDQERARRRQTVAVPEIIVWSPRLWFDV